MTETRLIRLLEYRELFLDRDELDPADGETIYRKYSEKIEIDEPSMKTGGRWRLKSLGWVGSIPLRPGLRLLLEPKVSVASIFRMLEYAYALKSFEVLQGVTASNQLEDVYQSLANILAKRVLARGRRGFHRAYVPEEEQLPFVRGSIDIARSLRSPWNIDLHCSYQEHTSDIEENQLLAWTLYTIARQGICTGEILQRVRTAWRSLHGVASTHPFHPADCVGRLYNRLNNDYRPLHALCRFFLEHAGASHAHGEHEMIPFLVDMAQLYEMYVANYLAEQLPDGVRLCAQQSSPLSRDGNARITIDMVLTDTTTGETLAVLDTKYKDAHSPSSDDLHQIVAYASAKNCRRGVLIYPVMPNVPFNGRYGEGSIEVITACVGVNENSQDTPLPFLRCLFNPTGHGDS